MEADIGVSLIKQLKKKGARVSKLVMDDDATTMARVRQKVSHKVEKYSDLNHKFRFDQIEFVDFCFILKSICKYK